ncbi:UDP-galactopyranose mutase [Oribacterium sp. NK2B42]|uniref:UDP-galactopyranose/dTDP-fucopyranose mutase family protein n=1 Tax=Oribacterium sp. NK2B42 TaxID=689781 RepID=UPI002E8E0C44|nr:UDP-galactopyranose mutase [Oribacterium sp. NK2B42]
MVTPEEAAEKIESQRREADITEPKNLEEQAISLVGTDIYEKLIKGYTEKQWGRPCTELPAFIIKRLPVRLTFDNNYFNALYQGIPVGGYTKMVAAMLGGAVVQTGEDFGKNAAAVAADVQIGKDFGQNKTAAADVSVCGNSGKSGANVGSGSIEVHVGVDFFDESGAPRKDLRSIADKVVYTGAIDAYFGYKLGYLEYRSVRFENELLDKPNFQGNAAVNYTDRETPWTRIIEHKWFEFGKDDEGNDIPKTVISREFSSEWKPGDEPYYPVNDEKNGKLYEEYKKLADAETGVIFGGRLGEYKYYDMDKVIASALDMCERELGK